MGRTITREIAYKPLPSAAKWHSVKARYRLYSGPVGSGKSKALVNEVLRLAVVNPGCYGLVGAPTFRLLHDSTQRAFVELLVENAIPFVFKKADDIIILTDTNTSILFRSLENPERLVALNLAFFAIDEAAYVDEKSFLRLQARLREPRAKELAGIAATTPAGFNWVWDRWFGDKKTEHFEAVTCTPGENYYLPSDYYDTLAKSYDQRFYEQEVLGKYLSLQGGTGYYAFARDRNIDPAIQYDPGARLLWTLDFNVNPMCSVIGQITSREIDGKQQKVVEIIDEINIRDGNVDLACSAFVDRTKKWTRDGQRLKVNVYGDPAGNSRNHAGKSDWQMVWDYMGRYPEYHMLANVASSHSLVRDRVNAVNGALVNAVGESRVFIHPRCVGLIKDLERVVWKKDSHGNTLAELDKGDPTLTHLSDSFGYAVEREFPLSKRIYVGVV
jgi:hypothetical protein